MKDEWSRDNALCCNKTIYPKDKARKQEHPEGVPRLPRIKKSAKTFSTSAESTSTTLYHPLLFRSLQLLEVCC